MTAVIVDLDDTLYPQAQFLAGAFDAVARAAASAGLDGARVRDDLDRAVTAGSDTGRVITDALGPGVPEPMLTTCVAAFRAHRPDRLEPYPGVRAALARLGRWYRIGILTDGNPPQQRAKLAALRLGADLTVLCSDELGRSFRKPHPLPFRTLVARLGTDRATVIGDRPDKDIAGSVALGWPCVRVRTGEWADVPTPPGVMEADDFAAAVELVLDGRAGTG